MAYPKYGVAHIIAIGLVNASSRPDFKAGPTIAAGDFKVSKDGGAFANLTNLPAAAPAAGVNVELSLTATEMQCDRLVISCIDQTSPKEWDDVVIYLDVQEFTPDDIKGETATILADTNELQTDWVNGGRLDLILDARASQSTADSILTDTGTDIPATLATIAGYLDTEIAAIKAKTDNLPAAPAAVGDIPTAAAITAAVWGEAVPGAYGVGTAGKILGTNLDGTVSSRASQTSADTIAGYLDTEVAAILAAVDTEVAAIKAKTDNLPAAPAATGDIPTAAAIADAVWDEATAGHTTAGTTGKALTDAGSAGDPWATSIPGAYGAGSAGYILGTNLDGTVSSRASQSSVDTIAGYLDTEVAAILAAVDTEVAAIKAKTDLIPASPAAVSDVPTATQNADALLNRDMSAVTVTNARSPINAFRFLRNKWTLSGTTLSVKKEDDTTEAWSATVTTDAAAEPVTGSDPA